MKMKNSSEERKKWKEVQDVGKRKARWDGNGKEKEWRKRSERDRIDNLHFKHIIYNQTDNHFITIKSY